MSEKLLEKIILWGSIIFTFLIPLFFLPITVSFYEFNKNILLFLFATLALVAWALKIVLKKEIRLVHTPFGLPLLLLTIAFVLSTVFVSPNKAEALLTPGATGTILAATFLYFFLINNLSSEARNSLLNALSTAAAVLALIAVYQFIGIGEAIAPFAWMKSKLWTPVESPLTLTIFLLISLPLVLLPFFKKFRKSFLSAAAFGLAAVLICLGFVVTLYQILPPKGSSPILLPFLNSWAIAIEGFKQTPLFGVGPENFLTAFNRFRPILFNRYPFWDVRFEVSSSYPLHLLTTVGILGLIAFLWLVLKIFSHLKPDRHFFQKLNSSFLSLLIIIPVMFFLPTSTLIIFVFFILLACSSAKTGETQQRLRKQFAFIPLILSLAIAATVFYLDGRAYAAEIYFKKSLDALAKNLGAETYNNQIKAISLNPQRTRFRFAYSQTNFALANALAARKDLSDQDRSNISQLVQQAIREAKIATVLSPDDAANWENLAQIYRNLINFASGADQWAIAAYQQAIRTDPVNPRIRVNLGGLFYALGNYDGASRQFQMSIDLKPDYANGYYNLAAAYREQKKYLEAYQTMQITVNLVPSNSPDWQKAKIELDDLAKKIPPQPTPTPQPTGKPEEALTKPQPLPSPVIKPPLELPKESEPILPTEEPGQ